MPTFTVHLEDQLTHAEIRRIIDAIEQMRGVLMVGEQGSGQGQQQNSPGGQSSHRQSAPSGQQSYQQRPQAGPGGQNMQYVQQPQQQASKGDIEMSEQVQRKFISQAIKWGVHTGKVSMDKLSSITPEESIKLAFDLANQMSEEDKSRLAQNIQDS